MTTFNAGAATDKGQVRSNNQDSNLVVANRLFAVADGMGGHRGGEVASAVALEALESNLGEASTPALLSSVSLANEAVFSKATSEPDLRGMGTTLCAVALVGSGAEERIAVVNVGDSRIYLLRGDSFEQLTEDHSLVESLVRQGRLSSSEAESHPQRNILTRALGIDARVEVDSWELPAVSGDRYLLCSDGLFNEVDEARIAATLRETADPNQAAQELVRLANEGGGRDNITCVVVDVVEGGGSSTTAAARTGTASEPDLSSYGGSEPTGPAPAPPPPPPAPPQPPSSVFGGGDGASSPERTDQHPAIGDIGPEQLAAADEIAEDDDTPRSRRVTWRVVVFVVALLGLFAVVAGALWWVGRNTYYVGFNGRDQVTVFRGQPEGFLIFDPTVEQTTDITRDELQRDGRERVAAERNQSSADAARTFVDNLCRDLVSDARSAECPDTNADDGSPPTTRPTTSTTQRPRSGAGTGANR